MIAPVRDASAATVGPDAPRGGGARRLGLVARGACTAAMALTLTAVARAAPGAALAQPATVAADGPGAGPPQTWPPAGTALTAALLGLAVGCCWRGTALGDGPLAAAAAAGVRAAGACMRAIVGEDALASARVDDLGPADALDDRAATPAWAWAFASALTHWDCAGGGAPMYACRANNRFAMVLSGPPGTGKTSLVRSIAYEAGVSLYTIRVGHFIDARIGRSQRALAALCARLREAAREQGRPVIALFDEGEALLAQRRPGGDGASQEYARVTGDLLQEMGRCADAPWPVAVVLATNFLGALDTAALSRIDPNNRHRLELPSRPERLDFLRRRLEAGGVPASLPWTDLLDCAADASEGLDYRALAAALTRAVGLAEGAGRSHLRRCDVRRGMRATLENVAATRRAIAQEKAMPHA